MKYLKIILPVFLTVVLLAGMLLYLSILTSPKNNTQEAGHDAWAAYGFEAEAPDSIDMFMLGDSESRTSISPMELFHNEGITSYCCGINSNILCEVYDMLKLVLKEQHPKLLILECNVIFSPFDWKDALQTASASVFPVIRWHNRWKTLQKQDFTSIPDYTGVEVRKGYYHSTYADPAPPYMMDRYMLESDEREPLNGINRRYLKKIASVCRKNGIQLILMSMPSIKNWTTEKHNTCADLAEELGTEFLDLNEMREEVPIDWNEDTRDRGDHLNNTGMKKVCSFLGPYLREHFGLEDHRGDPAYDETWTDMYEEYLDWIS